MATVLPVKVGNRLVGSAVLVDTHEGHLLFATCLHLFGQGTDIQVILPPHRGNCAAVQTYPLLQVQLWNASVIVTDPFADLAILSIKDPSAVTPSSPPIVSAAGLIGVGAEVVVLGYPFAPIGSVLETWIPSYVTALAKRQLAPALGIDELVLSVVAHPGLSGSAVVGKKDGVLYGILRGALAPPEVLKIGEIPIATDTSVTFATCAHVLHDMLKVSKLRISEAENG